MIKTQSLEKFFDQFNDGAIVHCKSMDERNNVLRMLVSNGYCLGNTTASYIMRNNPDMTYLNPAFFPDEQEVCCYSIIPSDRKTIEYDDFIELFDETYAHPIDAPDAAEFSSMLTDLFFGKGCPTHA